ncbi:MAG: hypothetical protein DRI34_02720 [Deltaproteobacteria bacterium]|nr:MAG: hypothetical protein DRI34_02720 [Deltaproteobacteria bacterium]
MVQVSITKEVFEMNRVYVAMSSALVSLLLLAGGCGGSGSSCPVGQIDCGGVCVDSSSDRNNCGGCGITCLSGQTCQNSTCVACQNECTEGQKRCSSGSNDTFEVCGDPDGDTCKEWGPPQACPSGQICANGECVTSCSDECLRSGEQACDKEGANGYRVCGEYDQDDCLDWGPLQACPSNQTCVDGQCVASCSNTCDTKDAQRCAPPPRNGVETCGDHNSDGCLEWGGFYPCSSGETCDARTHQCSPDCSDDCTTGQRTCDGAGWRGCGQYDADLCLDWSDITDCQSWEVCNPDTGRCETACSDACQSGERRCSDRGDDIELCANYDADPCLEWGVIDTCGDDEKCENGSCVEDCKNECEPQGARICQNDASGNPGYRVCGEYDSDSCLEWSPITTCPSGQSCSNGQCSETCTDDCEVGERECFGAGWHECGEAGDGDSCRDWLGEQPCEDWEVCDPTTAQCVVNCQDACGPASSQRCNDDNSGYQVCGNWNADPCLEWSGDNLCPTGQICDPAINDCRDDCSNECPTSGAKQCLDSDTWQICGNWDSDSCLEWDTGTDCDSGYVCSNGTCALDCADECAQAGTTVCDGTSGWRLCDQLDADSCLDLGSFNACAGNEECQNGECVVVCTDDCTPNELQCSASNDAVEICAADGDSDPCFEWKIQQTCTSGSEVCHQAACVSTEPPANLVISKVLYDSDGNPDLYAYIEIFGPADLVLDHYSIVGYNGSTDSEYMEIDLGGYTLPANGHLVLARTDTAWDTSLVDIFTDDADLQNGTNNDGDGVQIRWAGITTVDALAYEGDAAGEGNPADSADYDTTYDITYCLARRYDNSNGTYLDSDDNSIDFMTRTYCTPGEAGYGLRLAEYNTFADHLDASPAVDPSTGAVFVPSSDYIDEVLPDFSGYAWFDVVGGDKSSPALSPDGGAVYIGVAAGSGDSESGVYAYQTAAGGNSDPDPALLWQVLNGTEVRSSPAVGADGTIYVGTRGGGFVALNPADGSTKWTYPESGWIDSSPALAPIGSGGDELVVFGVGGVGSGQVVALHTSDGSLAWSYSTGGGCNGSPAVGPSGFVYIGCDDGNLYALDGSSGGLGTGFPVQISSDGAGTAELVDGRSVAVAPGSSGADVIYATSSGSGQNFNIVVFDGSSAPSVNAYSIGEAISTVTFTNDGGFIMSYGQSSNGAAFVVAYGPQGTLEWYDYIGAYDATAWITSSPNALGVVDGNGNPFGQVYAGTHDGHVYVYYWAAGLYDGTGSYPKFRANESNDGNRY